MGHKFVYDHLVSKFGICYISTTNKIEPPKSIFSFEEKKILLIALGIPANRIIETKNPYLNTDPALKRITKDNDVLIFGVGEKDMSEDPRFTFKPLKSGKASYYQRYEDGIELDTCVNHAYIDVVPTKSFTLLGKPMKSASELRELYKMSNDSKRIKIIKDLYGTYDEKVKNILDEKLG